MSSHICRFCHRLNPPQAAYCYFDGNPLTTGTIARAFGTEEFPRPFVLPSGLSCSSFEDLARNCRQSWEEARQVLKEREFRSFLLALGRSDLAQAAERATKHPNWDLGLDEFLSQLPGCQPAPPRLDISTAEFDLGAMTCGQDRFFTLTMKNAGERLLSGLVRSGDCLWMRVSTPQLNEKHFQATTGQQVQLRIYIRGKHLRAGPKPQVGELEVESNGGVRSVLVRIQIPITPFPDGVLKGALKPRELAQKAHTDPKEAARLLENGAVASWYQSNGWTYPIAGSTATGRAIVQQFFEALGLTMPTRVELKTTAVTLQGAAGGATQGRVVLTTPEKRPIHAHAQANQPWLYVGKTEYRGTQAVIPLSVSTIPDCSGQTLRAELSVQANGEQCFKVPISLLVGPPAVGVVKPGPDTGFNLPPLPEPLVPPLPDPPADGVELEAIPLAEARADPGGSRTGRRLSCVCLLLSLLLLSVAGVLAAGKLLKAERENTPQPQPAKKSATAVAPCQGRQLSQT